MKIVRREALILRKAQHDVDGAFALPGNVAGIHMYGHIRAGQDGAHGTLHVMGDAVPLADTHLRIHAHAEVHEIVGTGGAHPETPHGIDAAHELNLLLDALLHLFRAGVHEVIDRAAAHGQADLEDDDGHDKGGHGIGLVHNVPDLGRKIQEIREPHGENAHEDRSRSQDIRGEMQGVSRERLAVGLLRGLPQHAYAVDVNSHGHGHDRDAPERGHDRRGMTQKAVRAFKTDINTNHEEQYGLAESRQVLHLAVAIGMAPVRGHGGNADGVEGHDGRQKVKAAVQGLGQNGQRVGIQADDQLERGQENGRQKAHESGPLLEFFDIRGLRVICHGNFLRRCRPPSR